VLAAGGLAAAALLVGLTVGGVGGARDVALGVATAVALALEIPLPRAGGVPAGHAVAVTAAVTLSPGTYGRAVAVGAVVWALWLTASDGMGRALWRAAWFAAAAAAAGVAVHAAGGGQAGPLEGRSPAEVLAGVLVAGVAYFGTDAVAGLVRPNRHRDDGPTTAAVDGALLCSAALLALAAGRGWWMTAIAVLPLGAIRFSFGRFAEARRTYDQTIRALATVPELAGHVPMGHAERTAAYVDAMAGTLALSRSDRDRLLTAARLHHIGHVGLPEDTPHDPLQVARAGRDLLAETGFLAGVAEVVGGTVATDKGARGPAAGLAEVVAVASAFDDLVGEDPGRVPGALAIVAGRFGDQSPAVAALREALSTDPALVETAIGWGAPLTQAAAEAGGHRPAR
jgi:hypothetical protein